MRVFLVLLLMAPGASFARDMCNDPVPMTIGDNPTMLSPMAEVADDVLSADIASGDGASDEIEAVRRYLTHYFYMKHPRAQTPAAFSRCAAPAMYRDLRDAVARRVDALADRYAAQRWYLGDRDGAFPGMEAVRPGLLKLRILAHQYDRFEREVRQFLLSAVDDPNAADYFRQAIVLVNARIGELENFQQSVASLTELGYEPGLGLLPFEEAGLVTLRALPERIDALRERHVQHWLDLEAQDWAKIRDNPPNAAVRFVTLMPEVMTSITRLEQGSKVGLPEQDARIQARAMERGDWLAERERHSEAIPYYEFAGADDKAEAAQQTVAARIEAEAEGLEARVKEQMGDMLKSQEEQDAFDSETDALADELGIDLDDF